MSYLVAVVMKMSIVMKKIKMMDLVALVIKMSILIKKVKMMNLKEIEIICLN
jgi:hypothetical protein